MRFLNTCVCAGTLFALPALAQVEIPEDYSRECGVPVGYDCSTPGFEMPLTLKQAIELSRTETVVYLYGKGIVDARIVAEVIGEPSPSGLLSVDAVAVPGIGVPDNVLYVIILGKVARQKVSGEPVEFYQRYLDRGDIFGLTRSAVSQSG